MNSKQQKNPFMESDLTHDSPSTRVSNNQNTNQNKNKIKPVYTYINTQQPHLDKNTKEIDKLEIVTHKVDEIRDTLNDNVNKFIDRDESINQLYDKSNTIKKQGEIFEIGAGQVKKKMWWKNMKTWGIIICVLLIIIGVIVGISVWSYKS